MEARRDGTSTDQSQQRVTSRTTSPSASAPANELFQVSAPSITLPKGGGAIRGMGEKFAANPVTGTGSMTVPIATSPGRSGFGPQLSLSYDSGAGNGPFGFGWSLSLPSITRKTDKGLPKYQDADDSDVFILSGSEDLVPTLTKKADGKWESEVVSDRTVGGQVYHIRRYRPRIEGLFARIERWTNINKPGDVFWRSISKDNITTWYGKDENSRICDPTDKTRIFSWLICQSHDDKGNVIVYHYKSENADNVDPTQANEQNRTDDNTVKGDEYKANRTANRYLKRVCYGNREPYLPKLTATEWPQPPNLISSGGPPNYYFEVVFDYEDGHYRESAPDVEGRILAQVVYDPPASAKWARRVDPFSTYRAGFEVRTYRLCQRVLMFHHFPDELGTPDYLVRSTDFTYSYEDHPTDARNPIYSFLASVSQSGYQRQGTSYLKKSLPPVEFTYSKPEVQDLVEEVDLESLENLPVGLDGSMYQWTDLHGEGIPGILTEQGGAWFYKRNWSPVPDKLSDGSEIVRAKFSAVETVALKPNVALGSGAQFMDLAGDGQPDLVTLDGPTPGFYEHDDAEGWEPFRPFTAHLNRDTGDPNLKFVDLDGDGHADVLITEDDAFIWHPSLAEEGFGPAQRVTQAFDEEKGPRLVFADSTQSIHLADLSGDGLTDLVRIRNGEVCYWPNLGYGRFGAKVTMDNAPHFDNPDLFDQKRIRLADIDGSGTTDIIYLHRDGVRVYFNQSGNSWNQPHRLKVFPRIDDVVNIVPMDLLGNGTACLVWSSPLPGDVRRPMRYVNLMGGQKPHLLIKTTNNLGAETHVQYAPSTKFYLQDKRAGKPWITKLPFPVHCVEKVTVTDKWRKTRFASTYSYHHGYFDGHEREFRGFGRVEQVDVESYGKFEQGNVDSQYITLDKTLYQPPVRTVTWHHTGALLDRERILSQFDGEYFPRWFEELKPAEKNVLGDFEENVLPQPDLLATDLSAEEWREALRACKGMMLRQEVYELDVEALEREEHRLVKLFTTAYHNCHIRRLQPRGVNRHAVFLVAESEAITYHYELDLTKDTLRPDPRIAHSLNLQYDEYGNVLQSVAVVYPRRGTLQDDTLKTDQVALIQNVQKERHLAYTETRYTEDFGTKPTDKAAAQDNHRLRVPCEVLTYEVTGFDPEDADDRASLDRRDNFYFTLDELRRFRLSLVHQTVGEAVPEIAYHELPTRTSPEKRLVEHARTLFFAEDLQNPLPFGEHGRLGITFENYKLALTKSLLDAIFTDTAGTNKLTQTVDGTKTALERLNDASKSGYLSGSSLTSRFNDIPANAGQYWIRSGIAGFAPDAAQHFYLPERYTDPFGNITRLEYDTRDLFVQSSADMLNNRTEVTRFDHRVLAPREMRDINDNLSEAYYDLLGLPTLMAVKGKGAEGDNLTGITDAIANPQPAELEAFFNQVDLDETKARIWLGNATARHVYYFGEVVESGKTVWGKHPACACGIVREQHVAQLAANAQSPIQVAFEYTDGLGSVIVKKVQAEPDSKLPVTEQKLRWIASGKTILNNKGKPVKQYEPYFSSPEVGHRFEEPREIGVTPVIYYDAAGRTVRTEMPDGSYNRVEFSPWQVMSFDQNDTVKEPGNVWFTNKTNVTATTEDKRAARLAEKHANTPSRTFLDSLGRDVISIAHNRTPSTDPAHANTPLIKRPWVDEHYLTFTKLDAEGKPLWIRDARKNLVMQYINPPRANDATGETVPANAVPCYDIAGNLLFQHSMDAGDRWMLNDAAGKPMLAWDSRGHLFRTDYDELHRPTASWVKGADPTDKNRNIQFEKVMYGDTLGNGLTDVNAKKLNLKGKPYQHKDTAGVVTSLAKNPLTNQDEAFDFKDNLLRSTRQLVKDYRATPDWSQTPTLETEVFTGSTRYDALNRPIQLVAPHSNQANSKFNIIQPSYNEANLLEDINVWLQQTAEPNGLLDPDTAILKAVTNIDYNEKGQRLKIEYNEANHPIVTEYSYDKETFRLTGLRISRPKHAESDKSKLQDLRYTYDPVGNITDIRDDAQQEVYFKNTRITPSNTYVYDALYRLIEAEGREHAAQSNVQRDAEKFDPIVGIPFANSPEALQRYREQYDYDPVGNILKMHHNGGEVERWVRWYQYAFDSNRLLSTRSPGETDKLSFHAATAGYNAKYTYDAHGSMTSMPHLPVMEWDFKDQLHVSQQQVVNNGTGEKTYYVYDGSGERVRKVTERQALVGQTPTRKTERIYLGRFEVYREYGPSTGSGQAVTLERETLHVMDDKQRIALVETKTIDVTSPLTTHPSLVRYQLGNHLGSAVLEVDEHAQVITYEEYAPYGTTAYCAGRSAAEMSMKRYRYTGKERDEETGLSYHSARYYVPWLGRWGSCDPIGIRDGLNIYAYVDGNPIHFLDPSGYGKKEQQLGARNEKAVLSQQSAANASRQQAGLDPVTVRPQERTGGVIPDQVNQTPKGRNTVLELKARHLDSARNSSASQRKADILENLEQVKAQIQELESAGKIGSNDKGVVLRVIYDSDKGASSRSSLPQWKAEANAVYEEWIANAPDAAEAAKRARVRGVVTANAEQVTNATKQSAANFLRRASSRGFILNEVAADLAIGGAGAVLMFADLKEALSHAKTPEDRAAVIGMTASFVWTGAFLLGFLEGLGYIATATFLRYGGTALAFGRIGLAIGNRIRGYARPARNQFGKLIEWTSDRVGFDLKGWSEGEVDKFNSTSNVKIVPTN